MISKRFILQYFLRWERPSFLNPEKLIETWYLLNIWYFMKKFLDHLLGEHYFSCSEAINSNNAMKLGRTIKFDIHEKCKSDEKYNLGSNLGSKIGTVVRYNWRPNSKLNSNIKDLAKALARPLTDARHLKFWIVLSLQLSIKLMFYFSNFYFSNLFIHYEEKSSFC